MFVDSYPYPADDVVDKLLEHEAILVLTKRAQIKVINEVGALIWQLADGTRTIAQIANQVCQEYNVVPDQALTDTQEFIKELVEREALALSDRPVPIQGAKRSL